MYGSYSFPTSGTHEGGLIARSLAGAGKKMEKTKVQLQKLSGREVAIAGESGASVSEEFPLSASTGNNESNCPSHLSYTVNFIQHPPEGSSVVSMKPLNPNMKAKLSQRGYAIKKGGGPRVTFSQPQKDIMIEFYNRQANYGVRA